MTGEVRRILVVDDDEDIREHYAGLLRTNGFDVDTARDARSAVELLAGNRYALALVDMSMPDLSGEMSDGAGEQLYGHIRLHRPYMGVVILTAMPSIRTATRMVGRGATYLSKLEYTGDEVLTCVRTELARIDKELEALRAMPLPPSSDD